MNRSTPGLPVHHHTILRKIEKKLVKYLSPWRSLTHSKLKTRAFRGRSPGNCQEWDIYKEICPREFLARSQMTSAERGWVSDHQTRNCFDQTRRHCPLHGTASGVPKERISKKNPQNHFTGQPSFNFHNFSSNNARLLVKPPKRLSPSPCPSPVCAVLSHSVVSNSV